MRSKLIFSIVALFVLYSSIAFGAERVPYYRLYNPNNGMHFYTESLNEYNTLGSIGWVQEGIGYYMYNGVFHIDSTQFQPWYRIYNPNNGQHHWTMDENEYNTLGSTGWTQEGIAGYVFDSDVILTSIEVYQETAGAAPAGYTKTMIEMGTFSDDSTEDLTDKVTWSSNDTDIATVSNSVGEKGVVTGASKGEATITATDPSTISNSVTVEVTDATVTGLSITPDDPEALPEKYRFTQQFTAKATLSNGSTADATRTATWVSSTPSVASVSGEGEKVLVMALTKGQTTISASIGSVTDSVIFEVNDETLDSLRVSPSAPSPIPIGVYQQFTLTGVFSGSGSGNVERDMTKLDTVTWRSSSTRGQVTPTAVASISNVSDEPLSFKGEVLGLNEGKAFISATESVTSRVSPDVEIEIEAQELIALGILNDEDQGITSLTCLALSGGQVDTQQLRAIGFYTGFEFTEKDLTKQVTWTSSDTDVVQVADQPEDDKGFIACGGSGTATITATVPDTSSPVVMATITVMVNPR